MKRLIVYEATTAIPIGQDEVAGITMQEADELQRYIGQNKLKTSHFLWELHSLKIVNYVGYIQLSTVAIEILPKVSAVDAEESSRQALLMLLQESGYLQVTYSTLSLQQLTGGSLLEIFGRLFAEMLIKELRRGLCAGYIYQEENLSLLRGKLLVAKQISNRMRGLSKAFCGYDEFSVNQRLNQFLKRVTRLLLSRVRNLYTVELLAGCLLRFEGVEDVDFQVAEASQINVDRLSRRFEPALLLAKLFYQKQVMTMTQGKTEAFSILFAMNDLFEAYVGHLCARYLPYRTKIQAGINKLWVHKKTGRGAFSLRPDIIIEFEDGEKLIIDTKWKWIRESARRHGVSREDYFQMYAYLTRDSKVRATVLLYPHHEGLGASGGILECYHLENQKEKELIISSITYEDKKKALVDLESILVELMGSVKA
ncbi:MAG: McrC family protein [Pelosinus sp.]|nr:McrC family protein [Pelosinus sp.]